MNSIRDRQRWCRIGTAVATVAAGAWAGTAASANTLSFQQDVSPDSTYVSSSIGIQSTGANTANENFFATGQLAVGFDGGPRRSVFEFDLSAIEAAGVNPFTIDSVQLNIHGNFVSALNTDFNLELHLLGNNDDFDKFTITWNNAPSTAGGTLGTLLAANSFQGPGPLLTQPFTLTMGTTDAFEAAVQDALDNGDNSIRMILVNPEAETAGVLENVRFTSNNASTDSSHPELVINFSQAISPPPPPDVPPPPTAIPLPAAAWMALSMLGGLGGIKGLRKRFKK